MLDFISFFTNEDYIMVDNLISTDPFGSDRAGLVWSQI